MFPEPATGIFYQTLQVDTRICPSKTSLLIRSAKTCFQTGSINPRDQAEMQSLGVRGFLDKPLTEEKLMHLVARQVTS
jgi:hypothetical protein